MRFLILANDADATAYQVAAALQVRHQRDDVALVTMRDLAQAESFTQALDGERVRTTVRLRGGVAIDSDDIGVVLNRLQHVALPQFARSTPADRDYAVMELYALLISWLTSLPCPVVNPCSSSGLAGERRGPLEWFRRAACVGLRTPRLAITTSQRRFPVPGLVAIGREDAHAAGSVQTLLEDGRGWFMEPLGAGACSLYVTGPHVSGPLSIETRHAAARLVAGAGLSLARVDFRTAQDSPHAWVFVGLDDVPQLTDESTLRQAVEWLEQLAAEREVVP